MRSWILASLAAFAVPVAMGQSFNIDFNTNNSGAGQGVPANTFKAAAGVAGTWNGIGSAASYGLNDVAGAGTPVTISRVGGATIVQSSNTFISGDDEKLLEDLLQGSIGVNLTFTFSNLSAGRYAIYTYALNPNSIVTTTVNVTGSTSMTNQAVGTQMFTPSYFVGATHALHVADVAAGATLVLTLAPPAPDLRANVGGIQLVKLTGQRLRMYVDDGAAALHNGASWADAFTNPTTALKTARYAGGINSEIWVANGIYQPQSTPDRYASFDIPNHVLFYGGFSGNENALSQRSPSSLTYLNGNIGNAGSAFDNCYNVVVADNTSADTLMDGFRVHNGYNDEGSVSGGKGAGLRLQNGSMTVRHCTFVNNEAVSSGGGVYSDQGSPTFVDCFFYNNEAFEGSAVYHSGPNPMKVYNCEFMSNDAFEGTVKFDDSDGMVAGSWFHGNYAGSSGGAVQIEGANSGVTVVNCTIAGNLTGQWGAGVYVKSGADMVLRNAILWANVASLVQDPMTAQLATSGAGSTITQWANMVQGAGGWSGSNPLFINGPGADNTWGTFDDNCALQEASPAVNAGNVNNVPLDLGDVDEDGDTAEQLPLDIDGNPRIADVVVDVGAFEFQPEASLLGDMNCDGAVTVSDIGGFVLALTNPSGYAAAYPNCQIINGDMNSDGAVTVSDIGLFVQTLTSGG